MASSPTSCASQPETRHALPSILLLAGRLVLSFASTLAGSVLVVQLLLWAAPGDPVDLVPNGEEMRASLEAEWGLSEPVWARFVHFLWRMLCGDLGHSLTYRPGSEVASLILPAAARSLALLVPALLITFVLGIVLAYRTASRPSTLRHAVQIFSAAPVFLLAFLLVTALNDTAWRLMEAGFIGRPSWFALPDASSILGYVVAIVAMAIGSGALSEVHAACEDEIVRIRNAPFIDAAIARGAPIPRHLLPNLVAPLAGVLTGRAAFFVGGLVVAEKVLHLPGAGSMLWQACRMRDYPLAMGIAVLAAVAVCSVRLASDLTRGLVDPRLREPGR
jgi:peptide/nickel transport system permease protein